jgi:hypothetical protein
MNFCRGCLEDANIQLPSANENNLQAQLIFFCGSTIVILCLKIDITSIDINKCVFEPSILNKKYRKLNTL